MLNQLTHGILALALALASGGNAQDAFDPWHPTADAAAVRVETRRLVLEGLVLLPGGAPAEGAVVVSSAGGRAVTDAAGRYVLEIGVAIDALETLVTAVGSQRGASLVASARVGLGERSETGTLELAAGGGCEPSWLPTFGALGFNHRVAALAVYDDGTGPALYAGGDFTSAGGSDAHYIAKWNGRVWSPVGTGLTGRVSALAVHDDGTGPALFVGGDFTSAGVTSANKVAKWNGTTWSPLGRGMSGGYLPEVHALAVYDDGTGPALFAGGDFTSAGGTSANRIAKWNGTSWAALGSGMSGGYYPFVHALAVYDDGTGPALFAGGGTFTTAGGTSASRIAKWNGTSWAALGSGLNGPVQSLSVYDDGTGQALFAGGQFTSAGGTNASKIAKWNGGTWSPLGSGMENDVSALAVYDDGTGRALFAGGLFTSAGGTSANRIAKWNGTTWSPLGSGLGDGVSALAVYDDGTGPVLFAGGRFTSGGGTSADRIAKWNGTTWSALGRGLNSWVHALAVYDDGTGPALFVGGAFTSADGTSASKIAKWNGMTWSPLGDGVYGVSGYVHALAVYDDGTGPALFAGGDFWTAGGTSAHGIAKWNGTVWSALGSGLTGKVHALAVYDDGTGRALFAGGHFTSAGGTSASHVAKWNGTTWSALGSGMSGGSYPLFQPLVSALEVYDDGTGPALFAGGEFSSAGGTSSWGIAKWNGTAWSPLGSGMGAGVSALAVYDDGTGSALFAGGGFALAGGTSAHGIAKWNGTAWSGLGSGVDEPVRALAVHDDGTGPALFAAGESTSAGGTSAYGIAKWNGTAWSPLGAGLGYWVEALAVYDDGTGPALFAGGTFTASPSSDSYLARWGGCAVPVGVPYCFGDGSGMACPCGNTGGPGQGCANSTGMGVLLAGQGTSSATADDLTFTAHDLRLDQTALLFAGSGGNAVAFGDGLLCAGGSVQRLGVGTSDAAGTVTWGPGLGVSGGWVAGDTVHFQVCYRDPGGSPCATGLNLSNGYTVTFTN